jgi:hypothetical protein
MTSPGQRTAGCLSPAGDLACLVTTVALGGMLLAGCGLVSSVKNVAHNVESNKSTMDEFTGSMKSGEGKPFVVTYTTTGSSPATIVYAVHPPSDLLFTDSTTGGSTGKGGVDLIVNGSGEYSCKPPPTTGPKAKRVWTCTKLGAAQAAVENQLVSIYTPAHWVAFLEGLSLAAGFAGDRVTRSSTTVNGFPMQCVDFQAPGVPGTSRICTTAQGILGYVKVATEATSFQIRSYSAAPAASMFTLPAGAIVSTG